MDNRKLPELKAEAKRLGLNNYSRLRKQELIDLLRNQTAPASEPSEPSEARTKKIPAPVTKKIEISPKELERKIKRLKKKLREINQKIKQQSEKFDWSGLKFPAKLNQIAIFEKNNPEISVNVFGFEGVVYPLRISKKTKSERIVNLLLISDGEKQHYCLIKSLSRLLSSQVTKHDHAKSFCLNCLNHFPDGEKLKIHEEYCWKNQAIKIEMSEKGSFIYFIHHNQEKMRDREGDAQSSPWDILISVSVSVSREVRKVSRRAW